MNIWNTLNATNSANQDATVFEIVGVEKMNSLLYPAYEQILAQLATRYYRLLPIHRNRNIIFILLMSGVNYHYLTEWSGSFAETFYGLKRLSKSGSPISKVRNGLLISMIELVLYPSVKNYADSAYKEMTAPDQQVTQNHQNLNRIKRFKQLCTKLFLKLYPLIRTAEGVMNLLLHIAYAYRILPYNNLWQIITKFETKRITSSDYRIVEEQRSATYDKLLKEIQGTSKLNAGFRILYYVLGRAGKLCATSLPALILLLRFYDWWNASEYSKAKDTLPIPPPPHPLNFHPDGIKVPENYNCPICRRRRVNPAALNGVVYCYTCIYSSIQEYHRCPVSLKSASVESIRKIYDS